jgi:hypothetical protein
MPQWFKDHSTEIKLFVTVWLVYAVYVTPAGGVLPNRYIDLVHAIVNEGRFTIDTYHENTIDKAYYNGHYYASALPGPAFLALPAYLAFKGVYTLIPQSIKDLASGIKSYKIDNQPDSSFYGHVDNVEFFLSQAFLTLVVLAVASALGSVLLFETLRFLGFSGWIALSATLFYAFGTNIFFYSTVYFDHVFSATLNIAAFYLVMVSTKDSPSQFMVPLVAGFFAGANILVEYPNAFVALLLGLWFLVRADKWQLVLFVVGLIGPILILMAYNYISFGNPIATSYMYETAANKSFHTSGFFGVTYPQPDRFASLLLSQAYGLFWFAPISLVGLAGLLHRILARGKEFSVSLLCGMVVAIYVVFYSSYSIPSGGATFGPRFLVPMLPFLAVGVAFAFELFPSYLIYGIGLVSALINWTGAQFGFATSVVQHFQDLAAQGPTLPVLGAILTHSTSQNQSYLFALRYHVFITLGVTFALIAVFVFAWKEFWSSTQRMPVANSSYDDTAADSPARIK